jgi:hypothetical protein
METYHLLSLRNTLTCCILLTIITLVPYPLLCIQRAFFRMGNKIHACRRALENTLREKGPRFFEIDMAEFDSLENKQA